MVFDITATLRSIESKLLASGYFTAVTVGEPKAPVSARGVTAGVFLLNVAVAALTLDGTVETHVLVVRLYALVLKEPTDHREDELDAALANLEEDLLGDFDLGATIRNVDVGGEHGPGLSSAWGYLELGGDPHRIVDVTLPLVVDDSATLAA